MKKQFSFLNFAGFVGILMSLFTGCDKPVSVDINGPDNNSDTYFVGGCLLLSVDEYNNLPSIAAPVGVLSKRATTAVFTLDCPQVRTQGQEGSCVAWGTTYNGRSISNHYQNGGTYSDNASVFSPEYVYDQIRIDPNNCASGSYVRDGLNLLKSQGVCTWSMMPYSSTNGCNTQPNANQKADAANHKTTNWATVSITKDAIMSFLLSNKPVIVAGPVDNAFQSNRGAVMKARNGSIGGHCYCVVGYDDTKGAFKVVNSWATSWGAGGFGYIDYSYISQWWTEAYVLTEPTIAKPGQATNPNPANSAANVNTSATLSWSAGTGTASHNVYFGTSNPPAAKGSQSGTTYNPGTLAANTTYYWRIDETNSAGTTAGTVWSFATNATNPTRIDRTDAGGTITVRGENSANGEGKDKAFDNTSSTKWLDFSATSWIRFQFTNNNAYACTEYTITSANDFPVRDPKSWTLKGSNDGTSWTLLDSRSSIAFSARFQKQTFTFSNTTAYKYYKIDNIVNNSGTITQLSEIELVQYQ